jgi:hypothetical protein
MSSSGSVMEPSPNYVKEYKVSLNPVSTFSFKKEVGIVHRRVLKSEERLCLQEALPLFN